MFSIISPCLQNSECACAKLPPAIFHYWAWHLFVEWWMCLRHTTTWSFSILITTFIYRIVNVLASHCRLQFFIIDDDFYLQKGKCACVTLPLAVLVLWMRVKIIWSLLFQSKLKHSMLFKSPLYNVNDVNVCKWLVAVMAHIRWLSTLLSCY